MLDQEITPEEELEAIQTLQQHLTGRKHGLRDLLIKILDNKEGISPKECSAAWGITYERLRVNVSNLRAELEAYYCSAGREDLIRVTIPDGEYRCVFHRNPSMAIATKDPAPRVGAHNQAAEAILLVDQFKQAVQEVIDKDTAKRQQSQPRKARRWPFGGSRRARVLTAATAIVFMAALGMLTLRSPHLHSSPVDNQVRELCLHGSYEWNKRTEEGLQKARQYFAQAIGLDSQYAPAHAGLAQVYAVLPYYSQSSPNDTFPTAMSEAEKALQLDERLAEAHTVLALINCTYFNTGAAEHEFRRALQLNGGYATAHHWYSFCLYQMNRIKDAIAEIGLAHQLDPNSLIIETDRARMFTADYQTDAAIDLLNKVIQLEPGFAEAHRSLAVAYVQKGEMSSAIEEAREAVKWDKNSNSAWVTLGYVYATAGDRAKAEQILTELTKADRHPAVSPFYLSFIYVGLGRKEEALQALERASRENSLLNTANGPDDVMFNSLRSDPRFAELLHRNAESVRRNVLSWAHHST